MPKYLTVHEETMIEKVTVESRWTELAKEPRAEWQVTLFTADMGRRWCEWDAPDRSVVEEIFREFGIKWSEIVEVEVTSASRWRLWEMKTGRRMKNCWEVTSCGRRPEDPDMAEEAFCPAAVHSRSPERTKQEYAGTYCWKAAGTFCEEKIDGTHAEKRIDSEVCPFFPRPQPQPELGSPMFATGEKSH